MTTISINEGGATTVDNLTLTGVSGTGYVNLSNQSVNPVTPSSSLMLYSDNSSNIVYKKSDGFIRTLTDGITANRTWLMPNATCGLIGDTPLQTLINKTIDTAGPNSIKINGTDITTLVSNINPLLTTSSPTFAKVNTPTINNGADINIPTSAGTLALTSELPSPANFVTLTDNQTISGIKTFSTAPIISNISNTGILTLPTSTDTLVGRNTTDTLTNKTIDTAGPNTIKVGGTDVTSIVSGSNPVLTTSSPSFTDITATGTLKVTGPKISPLPTSPIFSAGMDTLGNPRLQLFGDPANAELGSITFSDISGTQQFVGKIVYNPITDEFELYIGGSVTPSLTFGNTNGGLMSSLALGVTGTKNVAFASAGVYAGIDSASTAGIEIVGSSTGLTYIDFSILNTDRRGRIVYNHINDAMTFSTLNGVNALVLGSGNAQVIGSLGVGTNPTSTALTVNGYIRSTVILSVTRGANNVVGNSPSVLTITGNGLSAFVSLTPSATITTTGLMMTVALNTPMPDTNYCISITPRNQAASQYAGRMFVVPTSTITFTISNTNTNLVAGTNYQWNLIIQ